MDNYDEMQAGREMDAAVAREVMGWEYLSSGIGRGWHPPGKNVLPQNLPRYSTNISDAWKVAMSQLETMNDFAIRWVPEDRYWEVSWHRDGYPSTAHEYWNFCSAESAPLAICRAALKATEAPPDD